MDCVFCRVIAKELPADFVYEDDEIVAFRDIHPAAPVHVLVVPRRHVTSVTALTEADAAFVGKLVLVGARIAREQGIADNGFRFSTNVGEHGRQSVPHLHFHLMGGRKLTTEV
ncbi:MAG: histidine triad nucleotide-binding protein [Candidatus Kerfeldbacteria bacterium]|nr:histidine triad nucleotide-binding protein [Candidatus Kerfeldbacteria bacterium]